MNIHLKYVLLVSSVFVWFVRPVFAQVEHVPVVHPVYDVLMRAEAQGALKQFSSVAFPLQRKEITAALREIRRNDSANAVLSENDRYMLTRFEREFRIVSNDRATVFPSGTDSTLLLFDRLFAGEDDKFLFIYSDSVHNAAIVPLFSANARVQTGTSTALLADFGGRIYGTFSNAVGFFLQGTNGVRFAGERDFLLSDDRFRQNITFRIHNPNFFDITESHVRYDNDWFYASVGRETRLIGAGYFSRLFYSNNAMASDAIMLGARFKGFEYRFMHFSLMGFGVDSAGKLISSPLAAGPGLRIPDKYMAYHRIAVRGDWGEAGVMESVIYNSRLDLAYLNPFSFLRGVSNQLRDRDNQTMGVDATFRITSGLQIKGSFLLDDIEFGRIGERWWQNKIAWNLGAMFAPRALPLDATLEYAVVAPYTFSHSDPQNAALNDLFQFNGSLPPNSSELTAQLRYWYGGRYPVSLTASLWQHGDNITDANGRLVRNVGGNARQAFRIDANGNLLDAPYITFLDGDFTRRVRITLAAGFELARQWNVQCVYRLTSTNAAPLVHYAGVTLRFEDF